MTGSEQLDIRPGDVVSIVGCNGKTALLHTLAQENRGGTVLLSTTTHILFPRPWQYDRVIVPGEAPGRGINLLCVERQGNKMSGVDPAAICAWRPAGGVTLLECDGSRGLPFKGWADHEPVIPPCTTLTVGVCATWRLGSLFSQETVHRPERFQALTGAQLGAPVSAMHLAAMVAHPQGMFRRARGRKALLINTKDRDLQSAASLLEALPPAFCSGLDAVAVADLHHGVWWRMGGEANG